MKKPQIKKQPREQPLAVKMEIINTEGTLSYCESVGAWNLVRLKGELLNKLPKLKEKRANIRYKVLYHGSYSDLINAVQDMQEKGMPRPMLLFFYEVKED